jgi:hypothetical protein
MRNGKPLKTRPTLDDLIRSGKSMMAPEALLPLGYSTIESAEEAASHALPTAQPRTLRVYIVWDNRLDNFPLEEALDKMRETGAAMVTKVEEVT